MAAALIIACTSLTAYAGGIEKVEYTDAANGKTVTVTGTAQPDADISLRVYNKGKTKENLKTEPLSDVLFYGAQKKAGADGAFTFEFNLYGGEEAEGSYGIEINYKNAAVDDILKETAVFLPDEKADAFCRELNEMLKKSGESVTDEELSAFTGKIVDYIEKGYIVSVLYNQMTENGEDTSPIFRTMIYGRPFSKITDVSAAFDAAKNINKMSGKKTDEEVTELLKSDEEYLKTVGIFGSEALAVFLNDKFAFNRSEAIAVLTNPNNLNPDDIKSSFESKVISLSVGAQTKYTVIDILKSLNSYLDLDFTKYNNGTALKQQKFAEYISAKMPKEPTTSEIKTIFAEAVKNVLDANETTGGSGGAGGGGGSTSPSSPKNGGSVNTLIPSEIPSTATLPKRIASFKDLVGFEWAKDDISYLYENRYIDGLDEFTFSPAKNVTREELLKMLLSATGAELSNNPSTFADAENGAWYEKYVVTGVEIGIVKGVGDGKFGIGESVTRQDMAVMLYRVLSEKKSIGFAEKSSFTDYSDISNYAKEAVGAIEKTGILKGMDDGSFRPGEYVTRAQAAAALRRLIDVLKQEVTSK